MTGHYVKTGSGFYKNESGYIWVKSVDRVYLEAKKKPEMYLQYRGSGEKDFKYISGLFKTGKDNIYSMDIKNNVGVKVFFDCIFTEEAIDIQRIIT